MGYATVDMDEKQNTNIEIFAFINMPENEFHTNDDIYRIRLYNIIDQLCDLSGKLESMFYDNNSEFIKVKLLNKKERRAKKIINNIKFDESKYEILRFSIKISKKDHITDWSDEIIIHIFIKNIHELFIIANICVLGSIDYSHSIIFCNNKITDYNLDRIDVWPLQRSVELTKKIGWPKLDDINFFTAWNWFKKHDKYIDGFINNKTSRAINAFSRIFSFYQFEWDESIILLWSLIGIEALYVEGRTTIMEQVREKIYTLFGEPSSHKKIISDMYNFRSRFVHGDIDFPGFGFISDALEKYEKYADQQMDTVNIAIAILGSTLQYIIKNDWSGIKFSYAVSDRIE